MKQDYRFKSIDEFICRLREMGIKKAAFTLIDEKRAVGKSGGEVRVKPLKKLEVLAYKNAVIYRYTEEGDVDFDYVYKRLVSEGFELIKRSRNIL